MPNEYGFEQSDDFSDGLSRLQEGHVNKVMAFLRDHARFTPTKTIPGVLKALHGTWRGYYEFHVSKNIRLLYWVDDEDRVVKLRSLGQHRDWSRSKDNQGR